MRRSKNTCDRSPPPLAQLDLQGATFEMCQFGSEIVGLTRKLALGSSGPSRHFCSWILLFCSAGQRHSIRLTGRKLKRQIKYSDGYRLHNWGMTPKSQDQVDMKLIPCSNLQGSFGGVWSLKSLWGHSASWCSEELAGLDSTTSTQWMPDVVWLSLWGQCEEALEKSLDWQGAMTDGFILIQLGRGIVLKGDPEGWAKGGSTWQDTRQSRIQKRIDQLKKEVLDTRWFQCDTLLDPHRLVGNEPLPFERWIHLMEF